MYQRHREIELVARFLFQIEVELETGDIRYPWHLALQR